MLIPSLSALALVVSLAPTSTGETGKPPTETARRHRYSASLEIGFAQFRDALNQDLVYHGGQIGARFGYRHDFDAVRLAWAMRLLLGFYGSHGMPALTPRLDWLDVAVLFPIRRPKLTLWVGPGLDRDQRWYVNPMLQSGSFYWYAHYDLELRAGADFTLAGQSFVASLRTAVVSAASRPSPLPDPYFYDWRFTDLVARTHRNVHIGSFESIRHVEGGLEWIVPRRKHDFGVGYVFRFEDYAPAPSLRTTQHLVRLSWHQR